jgi:hypothetical protein
MLKSDEPESTDGVRFPSNNGLLRSLRVPYSFSRACLSRWIDHYFAILVNEGSDPTVPYQALVIRESAMLFLGFTPWGRKAFSAREAGTVEVYSPDSFNCITPTPKRANTIGNIFPRSCGPRRRPSWMRCISCWSGRASAV